LTTTQTAVHFKWWRQSATYSLVIYIRGIIASSCAVRTRVSHVKGLFNTSTEGVEPKNTHRLRGIRHIVPNYRRAHGVSYYLKYNRSNVDEDVRGTDDRIVYIRVNATIFRRLYRDSQTYLYIHETNLFRFRAQMYDLCLAVWIIHRDGVRVDIR